MNRANGHGSSVILIYSYVDGSQAQQTYRLLKHVAIGKNRVNGHGSSVILIYLYVDRSVEYTMSITTIFSLVRKVEEHGHHFLHLLATIWMVLTMQHQWRIIAPVLHM